MRIPVNHYEEVTDLTNINELKLDSSRYLKNEGGKLYLVEVWDKEKEQNDGTK